MSRRHRESSSCHGSSPHLMLYLPAEVFDIIMVYLSPKARCSLRLCNSAMCSKVDGSFFWRHQTLLLRNLMKFRPAQWEMLRQRHVTAVYLSGSQYYEVQLKAMFQTQPQLNTLGISTRSISTLANLKSMGLIHNLQTLIFTDCHFPGCIVPVVSNVLLGISKLCLLSCQNNASWIVDFLTSKTHLQHVEVDFAMHPFQLRHVKVDAFQKMLSSMPKLTYLRFHNVGFRRSEENVDTPTVVNLQTLDLQVVDISDTSTFHSFCGLNFENFTQLRTLRVSFIGHPPNLSPYKTLQNQLPTSLQEFEWNISASYRPVVSSSYCLQVLWMLPTALRHMSLKGQIRGQVHIVQELPLPLQAALERLHLSDAYPMGYTQLLHVAKHYTNLHQITFRLMENCSSAALAVLARLTKLRHVVLLAGDSLIEDLVDCAPDSGKRHFKISVEPS